MQLKSILIFALAATCLCTTAYGQKKKNAKKAETTALQPVSGNIFSYAAGVSQSGQLKQYIMQRAGIDSANIFYAAQGMIHAATLTEAQIKQIEAYAAGLRIAQMNETQIIHSLNQQATGTIDTTYTNLDIYTKGLADGLTGKNVISSDSANNVVEQQFNFQMQKIKQKNADYLAENGKKKDVKTTKSGLQYRVIKQGTGAVATDTTEVEVHYEGKLIDGTVFDSSYKRNKPATFKPTQVIKGWTEALKMMPEGSVYELYIPYELAYGERGNQSIPPFSTLVFKVEVLKVKP